MSTKTENGNLLFPRHLLVAYREWCGEVGNNCNIVIASKNVLDDFLKTKVQEGILVLNISHTAVTDFIPGKDCLKFTASFNKVLRRVTIDYKYIEGVVSPIDGMLMPINVHLTVGPQGPMANGLVYPFNPETHSIKYVDTADLKLINSEDLRKNKESNIVSLSAVRKKKEEDKR